jgi:hypothetical protein
MVNSTPVSLALILLSIRLMASPPKSQEQEFASNALKLSADANPVMKASDVSSVSTRLISELWIESPKGTPHAKPNAPLTSTSKPESTATSAQQQLINVMFAKAIQETAFLAQRPMLLWT